MSSFPQSFDPIRVYDKPDVFLTQLMQGEASFDSLRRTFLAPDELTLEERDSFTQDIKDAFGNNEITDTMVDIATNPFVLLSFLITPPAGQALKKTGRLFSGGDYSRFLKENGFVYNILHALRLLGPSNQLRGTPGGAVLSEMQDNMIRLNAQEMKRTSASQKALLNNIEKKTGLKLDTLDPDQISDPAKKAVATRINAALWARMSGAEGPVTNRVVDVTPFRKEDQVIRVVRESKELDSRQLDDVIADDVFEESLAIGRRKTRKLEQDARGVDKFLDKLYKQLDDGEITTEDLVLSLRGKFSIVDNQGNVIQGLEDLPTQLWSRDKSQRVYRTFSNELDERIYYKTSGTSTKIDEYKAPTVVVTERESKGLLSSPGQKANVQKVFDEFEGMNEHLEAMKKFRKDRLVLLFGDETIYKTTGSFMADKQKILRLSSAISSKESGNYSEGVQMMLDDVAGSLLSDDVMKVIRSGDDLSPAFQKDIENTLVDAFNKGIVEETYMPRNIMKSRDKSGKIISKEDVYSNKKASDKFIGGQEQMRRKTDIVYDHNDLEELQGLFGTSKELEVAIGRSRASRAKQLQESPTSSSQQINFHDSWRRYSHSTAIAHTMHVQTPGARVTAAIEDSLTSKVVEEKRKQGGFAKMRKGASKEAIALDDLLRRGDEDVQARLPLGGVSLLDTLEGTVNSIPDTRTRDFVIESVLPSIMGRKANTDIVSENVFKFTQQAVRGLANSSLGKTIENSSDSGANLVQQMRNWSDKVEMNLESGKFGGVSGATSRALYASHLGLNMGSVMLNMLQPITMGMPLVGVGATVRAYRDSMRMMAGYASDRVKMGGRITDAQKQDLLNKHFVEDVVLADGTVQKVNYAELADIGVDPFHMVDEASLRSGYKKASGPLEYWLFEGTMKPFEKAEWFNRLTMAHAAKHVRRRAGKLRTYEDVGRLRDDASDLVQRTQFGSDPVNRPEIFYNKYFQNPLARQFLQFPLRQITGTFMNAQDMGGSGLKHIIKAMGYSAIAYETGKNVLDMDLSRGLFVGSIAETFGGDRFFREQDPTGSLTSTLAPPALDIVLNAAQAIGSGDVEFLKEIIPRTIPGGVAVSRVLGAAPSVPGAIGLQRNFADWSNVKEGQVPFYKADGRFLGNMDASSVIFKALGADMRQFKEPQQLSGFMLKNRDQMREYRRNWISNVLSNNIQGAEDVKNEFERRFKLPLTVSKSQLKNAVKLRESSVVARISDTMEVQARKPYREFVPDNYFDKAESPKIEAETAQYIWQNLQSSQNPQQPGMTQERQ
jgi:hypothetical protein